MTNVDRFDAIVVGGGPAGTACSMLLARNGLKALLIDKAKFPREKVCGDCIHPSSWHFFETLGVADQLLRSGIRRIGNVKVANMRGDEVSVAVPVEPTRPFFALNRSELDAILLEQAAQTGVEVLEEGTVFDISHPDDWDISVRTPEERRHFRTRCLVGADGRNSTVATKIGAHVRYHAGTRGSNRVGVQWHTPFQTNIGSDICLCKFESGYGGVVNTSDATANIALVVDSSTARLASTDFSQFLSRTILQNPRSQATLEHLLPLNSIRTVFPINPIHRRSPESTRAFLIGDARRTVEPFTGQGVCLALQDGVLAAGRILEQFGKRSEELWFPVNGPFWANRLYSPMLRMHTATEMFVRIASTRPWISQLMKSAIFRGPQQMIL